jgi:hypothetical protein
MPYLSMAMFINDYNPMTQSGPAPVQSINPSIFTAYETDFNIPVAYFTGFWWLDTERKNG